MAGEYREFHSRVAIRNDALDAFTVAVVSGLLNVTRLLHKVDWHNTIYIAH